MAKRFDNIFAAWSERARKMNESTWFRRLGTGELDLRHYKGFLLETYHHAGQNPQIQAFSTMFFKTNYRKMYEMFYRHATSEIGHDLLALNDLKALGEDVEVLKAARPLPCTVAYNAYVIHQIQFNDPKCYLGYLFHLEFLPTQQGQNYMKIIKAMGAPDDALSFLQEHSTIDIGHNNLMKKYIEILVETDADENLVINATVDSCHLHQRMIEDALANGEKVFRK